MSEIPKTSMPDAQRSTRPGQSAFSIQLDQPAGIRSSDWVRELANADMMAIEAVLVDVYRARCEGLSGFALFDGGAHQGYHSLRMGALPGCEVVYAVEADPAMADALAPVLKAAARDRAGLLSKRKEKPVLKLVRKALQNDPRVTSIKWKSSMSHVGRSSIASSAGEAETIWERATEIQYRDDIHVAATTIDLVLVDEKRPLPFLKLDLEGADILSLMGAERTLGTKRPIVAFENSIHAPKVHGFTLDDFEAYLKKLDYVALGFGGERLDQSNWFGFFEAWLAPVKDAEWLSRAIASALASQAYKLDSLNTAHSQPDAFDKKDMSTERGAVGCRELSARHAKNTSAEIVESADPSLPASTRTVGWRELSADVAYALWNDNLRRVQAVEGAHGGAWDEAAAGYRARVRTVLRSLVKENMHFRQLAQKPRNRSPGEDWMLATGRLAWLLWLSGRRATHERDEAQEKRLWGEQADDYRRYVRHALDGLREDGIVFAEGI